MSQIGSLLGGAGVVTTFSGQAQCDQYIVIGTVATATPITGLSIEIDGNPFVNVTSAQTLLAAWAKWRMNTVNSAAIVGLCFRVTTGRIRKPTTYKFTNAGATTPAVFVFSDSDNGIPIQAATNSINQSSNADYEKFGALFVQTPANIASYEVEFMNGYKVTLTTIEMDTYLALMYDTEASGQLGGVTVIDNSMKIFKSIRINTNGVGACLVMMVKLPQAAFDILNKRR